jgi:hypothetical protein|tara:strand:- start:377 stop:598 length:222 start_codon:yes stop_codon:yes gene_type:complete
MQNDYLNNKKKYISNREIENLPKKNYYKFKQKNVDINKLLNRIKLNQKDQVKENCMVAGIMSFVIIAIALIAI